MLPPASESDSYAIVVGHDGRPGGDDAFALAVALADIWPAPVRIVVTTVIPWRPVGPLFPGLPSGWAQPMSDAALARVRAAREHHEDREGTTFDVRTAPSPGHGLHAAVDELDAALLVVGRSHTSRAGRLFEGSDTEAALHGAPCSVAIAPPGYAAAARAPRTVGVAYDGGHDSRRALHLALGLVGGTAAIDLEVLSATGTQPVWLGPGPMPCPPIDLVRETEGVLASARQIVGDRPARYRMLHGDARDALSKVSDIDLLLLGSRGYGALERVILGSTSTHLVRRTDTPLLVVPAAGARDADR